MPHPTILIMEDEPVIACYLKDRLEQIGYHIVIAESSADILGFCHNYRPNLALLNFRINDVTDGMILANEIYKKLSINILLLTGARAQDVSASPAFNEFFPVLHKPFSFSQLKKQLRQLLSA